MKEYDVYNFRFNPKEAEKRFEPWHCFDGQLIALKNGKDEIKLYDTFWMNDIRPLGDDCGKRFDPETIHKFGTIEFKCNLNDVEKIGAGEAKYYDPEDTFNLTMHHGYRAYFVKKKGAKRSADIMKEFLRKKMSEKKREIEHLQNDLCWIAEKITKIDYGEDLNRIYID